MSWISENKLRWYEKFAVGVTKAGPVPNHVAFIMDGNRRFATKSNMKKKTDGHSLGFDTLSKVLQWCLEIGIQEVTVYAFSIENFKRSDDEVNTLLGLAREKFTRMFEERDKLNERGIKINVIGNISLLPQDIQQKIAEAMLLTKDNSRAILNVAFSYTSRDEITHSIKTIVEGVEDNDLIPDDVTEDLITKCLYTGKEPDLLVRTSGESRLSDFLLWQTTSTVIYFTEALWPEFTLWHLLAGVFLYQRSVLRSTVVKKILETSKEHLHPAIESPRVNRFLDKVDVKKHQHLLKLSKNLMD